jgi:hypothetical protein
LNRVVILPVRQATQPGGSDSLESILGLIKSFKIRSQVTVSGAMVTAASEQVLETAVAVGVNHQTPAFTGKFQHKGIFFADSSYCTYV